MLQRFNDIDLNYQNTDFHLHSTYTDGKNTMEEMVQQAKSIKLSSIAFTDHVRSNSDYLPDYFVEIEKLQQKYNIKIYKGIEARISDFKGNIAYPQAFKSELDIIIASVHRISINDKLYNVGDFQKEQAFELEKLLCLEAIKKGGFDILGHCGGMCIHFYNEFPREYFKEIIQACSNEGVAFELNFRYHKQYQKDLIVLLKKYNPLVSFGSDSHSINTIRGYHE